MLLSGGSIEILSIPPHVKRMAKGREIIILNQPFKEGFTSADEWSCSQNPEVYAVSQELTKQQLALIEKAVGSYSMNHIKAFLMRVYGLHEVKELKWTEILSYMEEYLHSQKIVNSKEDNNSISDQPPREGVWTKPASKREMMDKVGIDGYNKFNTWIEKRGYKIEKISRKLYQLCLDKMDKTTREKLLNM